MQRPPALSAGASKERPAPSVSKAPGPEVIPRYRMYRDKEIVLGPGKVELLAHIAETGSISEAARRMGMSYNRAWLHVKVMNENFKEPLVHSSRGGNEHGGASLTETGAEVLNLYRQLESEAERSTKSVRSALTRLVRQ